MKTILHAYNFDTRKSAEAEAFATLKARLKAQGLKCFETWGGGGSHYLPDLDGAAVEGRGSGVATVSHFYGELTGSSKAPADRRGSKASGITATLGTRRAQVRVTLYHAEGRDFFIVEHCGKPGNPHIIHDELRAVSKEFGGPFPPTINQHDAEGRN